MTYVDTPGLVDGDMVYPFDVNSAITWLGMSLLLERPSEAARFLSVFSFSCAGEQADLIFVFFDPMGQALCKRTLNIVEKLSEKCGDKLMFYLSKADEAGSETDRQVGPFRIVPSPSWKSKLNETTRVFVFAEGDDADSSGTVSPSRPQQMWL